MPRYPEHIELFSDPDMGKLKKEKVILEEVFPFTPAPEGFKDRILIQHETLLWYKDAKRYKSFCTRIAMRRSVTEMTVSEAYDLCAAVNEFPPDEDWVTDEIVVIMDEKFPSVFNKSLQTFAFNNKAKLLSTFTRLRRARGYS